MMCSGVDSFLLQICLFPRQVNHFAKERERKKTRIQSLFYNVSLDNRIESWYDWLYNRMDWKPLDAKKRRRRRRPEKDFFQIAWNATLTVFPLSASAVCRASDVADDYAAAAADEMRRRQLRSVGRHLPKFRLVCLEERCSFSETFECPNGASRRTDSPAPMNKDFRHYYFCCCCCYCYTPTKVSASAAAAAAVADAPTTRLIECWANEYTCA